MDPEPHLCWTLADLDACIRSLWHYHQMRIAGIVRLLLFDEHPLAHQVNRIHRLGLAFEHGPGIELTSPDPKDDLEHEGVRFATADLDPETISATLVKKSDLTHWLATKALRVDGYLFSVKEFVQQAAYVEGTVHAGTPRSSAEASALAARKSEHRLVLNFSEPNLELLKQIGRVTHSGLLPLRELARREREDKGWAYPTFHYG
jgi:hypothetical protein